MTRKPRRERLLTRRAILQAGTLLAGSLAASPLFAQANPTPIGTVEEIRGEAFVETGGGRRQLQPNAPIHVGDLLSTNRDARLVLKLGPATTVKLGGGSRLKIDRYLADTGGEFDMIAGHLQFERKGKQLPEGITFRSAYGLIAVRGTRFYAGPNRGTFGVLVGEGSVVVTGGGRGVVVAAQQGTDIKAPGQPPSRPAPWTIARVREMQANFR